MNPEPLAFDTPIDMFAAIHHRFEPYTWQVDTHLWLAGYWNPVSSYDLGERTVPTAKEPFRYVLRAANSSGKDSVIGGGFMPWFICTRPKGKVICTSSSFKQLVDQTEKPCRNVVDALNGLLGNKRFRWIQGTIEDTSMGSSIKFFATDDPGKAEGSHPDLFQEGAEMAIVMNEVKTINLEITDAMERNHGYNYWIEYSSPGEPHGHFFDACLQSGPRTRVDVITAYQCPHISAEEIARMISKKGIDNPMVRSSIFAEFSAFQSEIMIDKAMVEASECTYLWKDNQLRAGIDFGLGVDDSVMYVYQGPRFVDCITISTHDAVGLVKFFAGHIKRLKIPHENISVDGSGIGKPILSIFQHDNIYARMIRNDMKPRDEGYYLNKGAEIWDNGKMLIKGGVVEKPPGPTWGTGKTWLHEITTRHCDIVKGKFRLESKRAARHHGRPSPNHADAWMLVWASCVREEMGIRFDEKGQVVKEAPSKSRPILKYPCGDLDYETLLAMSQQSLVRANKFRPSSLYAGTRRS